MCARDQWGFSLEHTPWGEPSPHRSAARPSVAESAPKKCAVSGCKRPSSTARLDHADATQEPDTAPSRWSMATKTISASLQEFSLFSSSASLSISPTPPFYVMAGFYAPEFRSAPCKLAFCLEP